VTIYYTQASAGSGKTTSVERDVADKLETGVLKPNQIMAVTFTKDAASELKGRISKELLKRERSLLAVGIMNARVGTVHSIFGQLLSDFSFELGLSPEQRVLDDQDKYHILSEALDSILNPQIINEINILSTRLSIEDWRRDIIVIVELMRSNNFKPEQLDDFADDSISTLNSVLPPADNLLTEESFKSVITTAVTNSKALINPTKGLTEAIQDCETILRQQNFKWQNWIKVSKLKPTKMGEPIFSEAIAMGLKVLKSNNFRKDMFEFIRKIMNIAKLVIYEFAAIKRNRGLLDFVDQEQLSLQALENTTIQERIKEEIQYLIIDEFQDTSPIQLALFSRMSELVKDVLMVGDAKQAIYGFRGSDSQLILNTLDYVEHGEGQVYTLTDSYRSRPGLVALVNELFTQPFSHLLKPEQIQLAPKRTDSLACSEMGWWILKYSGHKSNNKIQSSLAEGIREHINSGIDIHDKSLKICRKATWRDLAVLCRNNTDAAELASCCARIGIPVSLERAGLIETPEISLALACLRRLVDPSDSLASAEILSLASGESPENWLATRLLSVEKNTSHEWNDSAHPTLEKLAKARNNISVLSTKEALDLSMLTADVHGIVAGWEESAKLTEHRLANLAKLCRLVDDYEDHCQSQFLSATPAGFILWLKDREQDGIDHQSANPGDAITITTYHRAKGLEWPIVICNSMDTPLKVSLYGVRVKASDGKFDWTDPLKGRSLCYWPNPFPDQKGNEVLNDAFRQCKEWAIVENKAKNEAIQLLYVGITRARDQVILPSVGDHNYVGDWLKLLGSNVFPPSSGKIELSPSVFINVEIKQLLKPEQIIPSSIKRVRHWLAMKSDFNDLDNVTFNRPASSEVPINDAICNIVHDFGTRININGSTNMDELGTVLHHCLALLIRKPDVDVKIIDELINIDFSGKLQTDQIISRSKELTAWVNTQYPDAILHTEMPFTQRLIDGSIRQGSIDLLVETPKGWIIIDHKSNPQPSTNWMELALQYSGQLAAYRDALEKLSDKNVLGTFIHFVVSGGIVEITY